jgi:hypothetical protein
MERYQSLFKENISSLYENKAINYYKILANLWKKNSSDSQGKYFLWIAKVAKPIKCVSYKDIPGLEQKIKIFLKNFKPKIKECYYNSYRCCIDIPGVEYVEGMANLIIPVNHAWNFYKGKYFDLTAEIVLKEKDVTKIDYAQVIKFDSHLMLKYANKTGLAGEYIGEFYIDKILKK